MDYAYDLLIRGGTVLDGSGGEPFSGDVAIENGKIVHVGTCDGAAREEIDATGKIVTPGFIDIHTHYDGQLIWSDQVSPSSSHGVTTVVTGNCGVGFAPCRPQDRGKLITLLEGVEDIPEVVMTDGLTWDWESFPEFIAALKRRNHDIDFAVQLPHSALRVFVMGDRAVDREMATQDDRAEMRRLAREAIAAGAIGFGTSRNIFHTAKDGQVIPTAHSDEAELREIAEGMRDAGGGVIQAILSMENPEFDFQLLQRVCVATGTPLSYTLLQTSYDSDNWRTLLDMTAQASAAGPPVTAQVFARPVGMMLGLNVSYNPFSAHPSYLRIAELPLPQRVAALRQPETRAAILAEIPELRDSPVYTLVRRFATIFPLGEAPDYEPDSSKSITALAAARGVSPDEIAYDALLERNGEALLFVAAANYENETLDDVREMLSHPNSVPALGDGGAHYGMICDSTYTTFMLTHWGRDRAAGQLPLPAMIRSMTQRPAAMMGMNDRGRLAVGLKADINVIDFDRLRLHAPHVANDLPAGGRRLTQAADGYAATIVSGQVIMRDGVTTGALPGRMFERA